MEGGKPKPKRKPAAKKKPVAKKKPATKKKAATKKSSDPLVAYNLKLKKKERIQNPCLHRSTKGGRTMYSVRGKGSDGTKMIRILGKETYEELKKKGIKNC